VQAAVQHFVANYPGKVAAWEIWNEPNNFDATSGFWRNDGTNALVSADHYYTLVSQTVPTIRDIDASQIPANVGRPPAQ